MNTKKHLPKFKKGDALEGGNPLHLVIYFAANFLVEIVMKLHSLLITGLLVSPIGVMADEYQRGYTTQRTCYKETYREEYVAGTKYSKGYVKSFLDKVEVPCTGNSWNSVSRPQYRHHRYYRPDNRQVSYRNSCSSGNATTGGILGGSLAAALSKKDAYGWSIPLGAVLGMGIANADC